MHIFTTDKIGHGYAPAYRWLADELGAAAAVCEIGVANGDGLVYFRHLFPHGRLVGVDINARSHFRRDELGVASFICEQDDPRLPDLIRDGSGLDSFNLIVDDASHDNDKTKLTFLHMWPMVAPDGYYVIEDWNHAGGLIHKFASELPVTMLREDQPVYSDVKHILYQHGMIILHKAP